MVVPEKQEPERAAYDPRCDKPKDREDSDLCEQRRMSKAAEDAAWWAAFQSKLGIAGFVSVLASLFFTGWAAVAAGRAAKAAVKSNEISHRNSVAANRAWIELTNVHLPFKVINVGDDMIGLVVVCTARNHGSSPATKIEFHFKMIALGGDYDSKDILRQFRDEPHGVGDQICFPGRTAGKNAGIFIPRYLIDAAVARRKRVDTPIPVFVFVKVSYSVLGDDERHETGVVYRLQQFDAATETRGKVAVNLNFAGDHFPGWAT